jgi:hypothetical protein
MKKTNWLLAAVLALSATAWLAPAPQTHAFPEPQVYSRAWEFDFTHSKPRAISATDVEGKTKWYWYMTYKVVNNGKVERLFSPEFIIASDQGDIVPAGRGVPASVFDRIKTEVRNPLLMPAVQVVGKLLIGEDAAKESVVIWPAFDHDVDSITIFCGGLSGETQTVINPVSNEVAVLTKTLAMTYDYPGTAGPTQFQTVEPKGDKWVMR